MMGNTNCLKMIFNVIIIYRQIKSTQRVSEELGICNNVIFFVNRSFVARS